MAAFITAFLIFYGLLSRESRFKMDDINDDRLPSQASDMSVDVSDVTSVFSETNLDGPGLPDGLIRCPSAAKAGVAEVPTYTSISLGYPEANQ